MKSLAIIASILLCGCSSNSNYTEFRNPPYIDIEIEGRKVPLRIFDKNEIRAITQTIDFSFTDDDRYRVRTANHETESWIWTTYPFPSAKGGTYPVSIYLQKDGRVGFVASMIREYEVVNFAYRDAVIRIARSHLQSEKESLKLLQK